MKKSILQKLRISLEMSLVIDEILKFGSLNEIEFNRNIQNLYSDKKNSRVKILGENQNNSLEKKIFLQIIDFSWRSHLQYLEQLKTGNWPKTIRPKGSFI